MTRAISALNTVIGYKAALYRNGAFGTGIFGTRKWYVFRNDARRAWTYSGSAGMQPVEVVHPVTHMNRESRRFLYNRKTEINPSIDFRTSGFASKEESSTLYLQKNRCTLPVT